MECTRKKKLYTKKLLLYITSILFFVLNNKSNLIFISTNTYFWSRLVEAAQCFLRFIYKQLTRPSLFNWITWFIVITSSVTTKSSHWLASSKIEQRVIPGKISPFSGGVLSCLSKERKKLFFMKFVKSDKEKKNTVKIYIGKKESIKIKWR